MMDIIEVLVKQSDEKVAQLRDYLAEGRAESFEEYKKLCGEIKGLLTVRGYAPVSYTHLTLPTID
jgi:hypothetical protein